MHKNFLSMSVCLSYLLHEQSDIIVDEVPPGVKENMWFLVKRYVSPDGVFDKFWNDCGAQSHHYGWKSYHLRENLAEVRFLQDSVYGMRRRVDGK